MTWRGARNEQGAATLLVSMGLLIGLTVLAQTTGWLLLSESREMRTVRAGKGVQEAAQAAQAYAASWLEENGDAGADLSSWEDEGSLGKQASLSSVPTVTIDGEMFDLDVTFERRSGHHERYMRIEAEAWAQSNTETRARVIRYIYYSEGGLRSGFGASPILINGNLNGAAGNPDVYPTNADTTNAGIAIRTTGTVNTGEGGSGLDFHDGTVDEHYSMTGTLWDHVFDFSKAKFQDSAILVDDSTGDVSGERFYYVNKDNNLNSSHPIVDNNKDVGSSQKPAIIVFSGGADCPKVNGSVTVYGIVYFEGSQCAGSGQGWGGSTIYGSAIFEGDVNEFTANTEFRAYENLGGVNGDLGKNLPNWVIGIPGTWRDYTY